MKQVYGRMDTKKGKPLREYKYGFDVYFAWSDLDHLHITIIYRFICSYDSCTSQTIPFIFGTYMFILVVAVNWEVLETGTLKPVYGRSSDRFVVLLN